MERRAFIELALSTSALATVAGCAGGAGSVTGRKRILVLGGTNFVGPAVVEHALARGHEVTLLNRGITRPYLFPDVEKLRGERRVEGSDLASLGGTRRWDAVIDVWAEHAPIVAETAALLADRVDYYAFVSSIAVYRDFSRPGLTEDAPTRIDDPEGYGREKAVAEAEVARLFPGRSSVARCHAIVGPRDNGTSYHYWLRRLSDGGDVLAPGTGVDPVQLIDVRDVAAWLVDSVETSRAGIHNLTGPATPHSFRTLLETSRDAIGSTANLVWVDADFLRRDQGVRSFSDLPLWAPLDEDAGFEQISGAKALAAGLSLRSLAETARDAWRWYQSHFFKDTRFPIDGSGLARDREQAVLAAWRARGAALPTALGR
jgi:2'-hydroxyisoflavone reductase